MSAPGALAARYDAVVCDLDGVVYRGPVAIPYAVESLTRLDVPVVYATNNASRAPEDVSAHLTSLGLPCEPNAVVTSSQAGAWLLTDRVARASPVLAVGGSGVAAALREAGFLPLLPADVGVGGVRPAAVLQGYGPEVTASDLAEAGYAVQGGALWVATNTDSTLPTDRGVAPGNGSLVDAVRNAVGHPPHVVAGKPAPPLYLLSAERLGLDVRRVLAVGDRLDTDIEGAVAAGMDSLLVLTGVDDLESVLVAPPNRRPTLVAPDLRAVHADPGASGMLALMSAVSAVHRASDAGADAASVRELVSQAEVLLRRVLPG